MTGATVDHVCGCRLREAIVQTMTTTIRIGIRKMIPMPPPPPPPLE
jgi:hypothetical protein